MIIIVINIHICGAAMTLHRNYKPDLWALDVTCHLNAPPWGKPLVLMRKLGQQVDASPRIAY